MSVTIEATIKNGSWFQLVDNTVYASDVMKRADEIKQHPTVDLWECFAEVTKDGFIGGGRDG